MQARSRRRRFALIALVLGLAIAVPASSAASTRPPALANAPVMASSLLAGDIYYDYYTYQYDGTRVNTWLRYGGTSGTIEAYCQLAYGQASQRRIHGCNVWENARQVTSTAWIGPPWDNWATAPNTADAYSTEYRYRCGYVYQVRTTFDYTRLPYPITVTLGKSWRPC